MFITRMPNNDLIDIKIFFMIIWLAFIDILVQVNLFGSQNCRLQFFLSISPVSMYLHLLS